MFDLLLLLSHTDDEDDDDDDSEDEGRPAKRKGEAPGGWGAGGGCLTVGWVARGAATPQGFSWDQGLLYALLQHSCGHVCSFRCWFHRADMLCPAVLWGGACAAVLFMQAGAAAGVRAARAARVASSRRSASSSRRLTRVEGVHVVGWGTLVAVGAVL